MARFGLIGCPLGHSLSASYFSEKFQTEGIDASYRPYEIRKIDDVVKIMMELDGFNVTIPYKTTVIPFLSSISSEAREINAVNCVKVKSDGTSIGFNTDVIGIRKTLRDVGLTAGENALILGTGGAAKAVGYVLDEIGLKYKMISRSGNGDIKYDDVDEVTIRNARIIINATPVGMYPATSKPNIPYQFLDSRNILFDLIYNPEITLFLREGMKRGSRILTGMTMFRSQAEASWEIWNDSNL